MSSCDNSITTSPQSLAQSILHWSLCESHWETVEYSAFSMTETNRTPIEPNNWKLCVFIDWFGFIARLCKTSMIKVNQMCDVSAIVSTVVEIGNRARKKTRAHTEKYTITRHRRGFVHRIGNGKMCWISVLTVKITTRTPMRTTA